MSTPSDDDAGLRALTQAQLDAFWRQGFLRFGKVLDDDLIELMRREYDAEFEKAWAANSLRNLAISDGGNADAKRQAERQMLQIMQMCERNLHFRRLLYHEQILDVITDILGPNIQLFHDQALFKPARQGGEVFWHQDNGYWRCRPANLVSCWITLDDVDASNGAMQLIPGSHLTPVWHQRSESTDALLNIPGIDLTQASVVELPAGGCMFHHCQTLHYTAPNDTDRQRRAFVIHFMPPGTMSRHSGEVLQISFARPLLRRG